MEYKINRSYSLEEKPVTPTMVYAKDTYQGQSRAELLRSYKALKKSGPHAQGSPERGRMQELAQAIRSLSGWDQTNLEEKGRKPRSAYAVGMSRAMTQTGDKPPLKKSTITKAHDIARAIMRDSVETTEPSITEQALARLKKLAGLI